MYGDCHGNRCAAGFMIWESGVYKIRTGCKNMEAAECRGHITY